MDKEKFIVLIKALKSAYSKPDFLPDDKAVKVWYAMLQDLPYDVLNLAIQKHIMISEFPPTIAEIRASAADILMSDVDDWTEAWRKVLDVMSAYGLAGGYEGLRQLDDPTREAVKRVGYWAICNSENVGVERANFRTSYEAIVAKKKEELMMSQRLKTQIEDARKTYAEKDKLIIDKNVKEA